MFGEIVIAAIILLVTIFSLSYHIKKPRGIDWWWRKDKTKSQRILQGLDTISSLVLLYYVILDLIRSWPSLGSIMLGIIGVLGLIILFMDNKYYEALHGIWHIIASFILVAVFFV